jgi:hypothetical protein
MVAAWAELTPLPTPDQVRASSIDTATFKELSGIPVGKIPKSELLQRSSDGPKARFGAGSEAPSLP